MSSPTAPDFPAARSAAHHSALVKLFLRIGDMSNLPALTSRLVAIAEDDPMIDDLLVIISSDAEAEAKILRRLNADYPELSQPVTEISPALNTLGPGEIWNLALTVSLSRLFSAGDPIASVSGYNREALWLYSVAIAKAAAIIAAHSKQLCPQTAYAAGMLHHVGYYLLDQHLKHHYLRFVALAKHRAKRPFDVTELEETVFTFNHATLGGFAAAKWQLPRPICDAIEYHHHLDDYPGEHRSLVATLVLAGSFCENVGWKPLGVTCPDQKLHQAFSAVQLPVDALEPIGSEIAKALETVAPLPRSRVGRSRPAES
jgi:HD-like signal output (HDOD) protein